MMHSSLVHGQPPQMTGVHMTVVVPVPVVVVEAVLDVLLCEVLIPPPPDPLLVCAPPAPVALPPLPPTPPASVFPFAHAAPRRQTAVPSRARSAGRASMAAGSHR